ncbi:MAG: 2,5-diketo-D-gluconic acid reductase B [Candidatus Celerinatantimonas neptuna]|nr:MAG: 2,5-diketo-D-gluconic acid reductase B [Candidatus Celerinatantimonas neptuna]
MTISRTVCLQDGTQLPALGQGTWGIGDDPTKRVSEIETLRRGVELGMSVIDSAEMYGDGNAESLVAEAIHDCREQVFLISKVLPHHASGDRLLQSVEQSLQRLNTDYLDLYLLHWRGCTPLQKTIEGLEQLRQGGMIRRWGVSNLDVDDMNDLLSCQSAKNCQVNQILYHLASRGSELVLQPYLNQHQILMMSYSPLAQAGRLQNQLLASDVLRQIADRHDADPFQIMLAWCIRSGQVLAIPKASSVAHVDRNAKAVRIELGQDELSLLDQVFPAPEYKVPLDII